MTKKTGITVILSLCVASIAAFLYLSTNGREAPIGSHLVKLLLLMGGVCLVLGFAGAKL